MAKDPVHWKWHADLGFISLLCKPSRMPDQEAKVTKTIEKCTCLDCLKLLYIMHSQNGRFVANSVEAFIDS